MAENIMTFGLQQLDDDENTLARNTSAITDEAPTVGEWRVGYLVDTNEAQITLPIAQVRQLYIENTHATAQITVKWTPEGGSKESVLVLGPGDPICFWHTTTGVNYGISALYLQSNTAAATYKMFIGG